MPPSTQSVKVFGEGSGTPSPLPSPSGRGLGEGIAIPEDYAWLLEEPLDVVLASVPDQVRELIELIGLEGTIRLIDAFQGAQIYIPKSEGAWRILRDGRIRKEFTGANHRALAQRYNLSNSAIYEIVRPPDLQGSLFGEEP